MPSRKKKPEGRQKNNTLVLFLALNLILLAFFILLVALSQENKTKEHKLLIEVRRAFQSFGGAFLGLGEELDVSGLSREQHAIENVEAVEQFLGELTRFVEENKESKEVSFQMTSEGLNIHISEDFSFREGAAALLERGLPFYNQVFNLILRTSNVVRIEGHTDNVEIRTDRYRDNWELSAARAMAVFRYFTASGEIPEARFIVAGHGRHRPLASNLTEEGRRQNRRVSIVFVGKLRSIEQP